MIGNTLAHYKIIAHIGSGGMGEVYRAQDTKLGREVALKLLPAAFANDPERVARFEREAMTLAKLQHANIAAIYGFEPDAEQPFLVMELVEGEDLAARLERGPIPVDETLAIAAQIAEGLEAAHALGIVHRDLKPANIKLTSEGDVKLLDFGLARAYAGDSDSSVGGPISNSPTITAAMTMAGVILGTAAYMSPEQARGRTIDRQADVWSFGVVLYEMLTGDRLFGGETVSDSIGAILHRDPDLDLLPPVPPQVKTLLMRCLARDKRQRLRDIGDARLELADAIAAAGATAAADAGTRNSRPLGWIAAAALALVAVGAVFWGLNRDAGPGLAAVTVGLPRAEAIQLDDGSWPRVRFSPDGKSLLYCGGPDEHLYLRQIEGFAAQQIVGDSGVGVFVFSPDGKWIAYTAESKLWKIAVSGGAPVALCETSEGPGLAWGNGEIYFPRGAGGGLWAVSENGGELRPISQLDNAREETSHRWPQVLPDGRHLLVNIKTARTPNFDDAQIGVLSLDTGAIKIILEGGMYPHYLPEGYLVYGRADQLLAAPFDLAQLAVTGTPVPVLDDLYTMRPNGAVQAAFGPHGELAYLPVDGALNDFTYVWLHTSGRVAELPAGLSGLYNVTLSPDGTRVAGKTAAANDKIHIFDLARGIRSRLTGTPGNDDFPCWSPDGRLLAYTNDRDGNQDLYVIPTDGSASARALLNSDEDDIPRSWTPDGQTLLFVRVANDGRPSAWRVSVAEGARKAQAVEGAEPIFADDIARGWVRLSPNGRRLAYASDQSGELETYVCRYPELTGTTRVSTRGGRASAWSPDSRTLYYETDDFMLAAGITDRESRGGAFAVAGPDTVFAIDDNFFGPYSLAPDGERFLAGSFPPGSDQHYGIRVVFDWADKLGALPR